MDLTNSLETTQQITIGSVKIKRTTLLMATAILFLFVSAFLRFYDIGTESYWHDEITMVNITSDGFDVVVEQTVAGRPPLYVALGYVWVNLFGNSEAATRSLSAIPSIIAVFLTYVLGRELFKDQSIALMATLFMGLSAYHIHHAQDYRYYALMLMFTVLATLMYVYALRYGKWQHWVVFVLSSVAAFYTHTHAMFFIFGVGFYFLIQWYQYDRQRILPWVASQFAILAGMGPGLYITVSGMVQGVDESSGGFGPAWIPAPGVMDMVRSVVRFFAYMPYYFNLYYIIIALGFVVAALLIFIRMKGWGKWFQDVRSLPAESASVVGESFKDVVLLLCLFIFPIVLPFALSHVLSPMYLDRYVISASPTFYLLVALAIYALRQVIPMAAIVGAFLILTIPALVTFYVTDYKEQWPEAAAYVQQNAQAGDVAVVAVADEIYVPGLTGAFTFYYEGGLPVCPLLEQRMDDPQIASAFYDCTAGANQMWVTFVGERPDKVDAITNALATHRDGTYELITEKRFIRTVTFQFSLQGE